MQHLENDMDDLFQRAGENYPLRGDKGNWERVAKRIEETETLAPTTESASGKKNTKVVIVLLLLGTLISGGFVMHIFLQGNHSGRHIYLSASKSNKTRQARISHNKSGTIQAAEYSTLPIVTGMRECKTGRPVAGVLDPSSRNPRFAYATSFQNKAFARENREVTTALKKKENQKLGTGDFLHNLWIERNTHKEISEALMNNRNEISQMPVKPVCKTVNQKNLVHNLGNGTKQNKDLFPSQRKKGFYIGAAGGPDISNVKSGYFSYIGDQAGLLFGYGLLKKISFETGVLWNEKYYSSEGKHFNMSQIRSSMPAGMEIVSLESHVSLIELPLSVRYDFLQKANYKLVVSGGVSCYIMTKERNLYNATVNGNAEKMLGVYHTYDCGWPAVAELSVGYDRIVFKNLNIRIEPYVKLPLQGIGVGNLPVSSAGIQIGITRHFN